MNPLVSIIVPCYNQAQYLDECLQSVFDQTYQNWECFIVNDGSTDNAEEVAKKWTEIDSRFKYLFTTNNGVSKARNVGVLSSQGEYILPLDSDDYISVDYVSECLTALDDTNLKIVFGRAFFFGERQGNFDLKAKVTVGDLLKYNSIHCSGMYRRNDWEKCDGYDENMIYGFEDWEFWINMLHDGGEAQRIDSCVLNYRIKSVSRSTAVDFDSKKNNMMIDYIFRKHIKLYGYETAYSVFENKLELENKLNNLHQILSLRQILILLSDRLVFQVSKLLRKIINK